jgi:serine phosphatase RsbU (regulator of sigma subunit)
MPDVPMGAGGRARTPGQHQSAQAEFLREALLARADAEAAQVRADDAREEAERARAEAERARRAAELGRARLSVLAEAGRRMAESIDWETTVQAVVRSIVPAVADWSSLNILQPNGELRVVAVAHSDPEREDRARELIRRHPPDARAASGAANVIRTGRLEIVEDLSPELVRAAAQDSEHLRLLENLNVRHYVIAPLSTPDGVIGTLTFVLGDSGRRFEPSDLQLVTSLAARAALHIQNSRLYSERSLTAEILQAGLRPRPLPAIPGVELAGRFLPAGSQMEVGGDFYEAFRSGDGMWTVVVGDVSGKGPEAASVTALARHTLRVASLSHDDPATNLALLNETLVTDSAQVRFCTVFYARLCGSGDGIDCRFANGGHPAPLLLRAEGRVERVEAGRGPLVGVFADAAYAEATLHLQPGDLLLMYTDGVTEVMRGDLALGESGLHDALAACVGCSAEEVVEALERHALALAAGHPRDDIALLAVRATAGGANLPTGEHP